MTEMALTLKTTRQEFYMNQISSMDFPQHGEVFYFHGQALHKTALHSSIFSHKYQHYLMTIHCNVMVHCNTTFRKYE
jgi:hypothetical protein